MISSKKNKSTMVLVFVFVLRTTKFVASMTSWWLIAAISCAAFGFGVYGFIQRGETEAFDELVNAAYRSIQLFALEYDASEGVNWQLQIARWSACFVIFSSLTKGVFQAFDEPLSGLIFKHSTGHIIICGAETNGIKIANECISRGLKVILIDHLPSESVNVSSSTNIYYLRGDGADHTVLKSVGLNRCESLFLTHSSDDKNFDVIMAANDIIKSFPGNPRKCFIHASNTRKFSAVLNSLDLSSLETKLFNFSDLITRSLICRSSLVGKILTKPDTEVCILGNSSLIPSLILQIARSFLTPHEQRVPITVIGENAKECVDNLNFQFHQLNILIDLVSIESSDPVISAKSFVGKHENPNNLVFFICNNSDTDGFLDLLDLNDNVGLSSSHFVLQQSEGTAVTQTLKSNSNLTANNIEFFGLIDENCSVDQIRGETLDCLAKKIHGRYLNKQLSTGVEMNSTPAIVEWDYLSEQFKEANRRQADHIFVKLEQIDISLDEYDSKMGVSGFVFSDDEIELLSRIEHRRWCAEHYLDGWQFGAIRNNTIKLHPDLIIWEELPEEIREHDRDTIRQIPELINQLGFKLSRNSN